MQIGSFTLHVFFAVKFPVDSSVTQRPCTFGLTRIPSCGSKISMAPLPPFFRSVFLLAGLVAVLPGVQTAAWAQTLFPAAKAVNVNPDTHLVLTFPSTPILGKSGFIRIFDTATNQLVDSLDLSIPAGPTPRGAVPSLPPLPPAEAAARAARAAANAATPLGRVTNATAVAGTLGDGKNPSKEYQLTIIGGVQQGFHFHPVIIHGNVATIYPHHNLLTYGRSYRVEIDPGVLTLADDSFKGIAAEAGWTFTTKPTAPAAGATRVTVAADGSGDFNTVQGALDWTPDKPAQRVTIFVRNGDYEEIVFFHGKSQLTILGEDREKVRIGYGNNSRFNSPIVTDADGNLLLGPSRRCAFACYNSSDITLQNFTVSNYYMGQAEGLLIAGARNIVDRVTINGSGDALNLKGSIYLVDSAINGHGDTILSTGAAYFKRCTLSSWGPYMWIRNPATNHGHVFVECTFDTPPGDNPLFGRVTKSVLARLPDNKGVNYPYAEAVLIDCKLKDVPPEGWGPIQEGMPNVKFWEYNSTNLTDGKPVDVSQRHPASKQLTMEQDAATIANYRDPAFVLGGWKPE
jgi:pectinesterase